MKPEELIKELKAIGIPVAFSHFKEKQTGDYIIYTFKRSVSGSDHVNELEEYDYRIELYTAIKNVELEDKVTSFLDELGTDYEIYESVYIEDEDVFMTVISFSFLIRK